MAMNNLFKGVAEFFTPVLTTSAFYEVNCYPISMSWLLAIVFPVRVSYSAYCPVGDIYRKAC